MASNEDRRKKRLALIALVCMSLFWGYNWVVMKSVLRFVGPLDFAALRNIFAALALLLVLLLLRRSLRIRAWRRIILLGLLQTWAFSTLGQLALLQGAAGKTSFLVYTMPFWVIPIAWFAFGERIRGLQWLAIVLALGGLLIMIQPWEQHDSSLLSEALALGAGLLWALSMVVAKWIQRDYPSDVLLVTCWQMLIGSLALGAVALLVPERPLEPSLYFFGALAYNVLIATALAWFLWFFALKHLSAGVAGLSALGVPVVSVLASWLELGEKPEVIELLGMVLIGLALVVVSRKNSQ